MNTVTDLVKPSQDTDEVEKILEKGLVKEGFIYDEEIGESCPYSVRSAGLNVGHFYSNLSDKFRKAKEKRDGIVINRNLLSQKEKTIVVYDQYNLESFLAAALIVSDKQNYHAISSVNRIPCNGDTYIWVGVNQRERKDQNSLLNLTKKKNHVVVGYPSYIPQPHKKYLDDVFAKVVSERQNVSRHLILAAGAFAGYREENTAKLNQIVKKFYTCGLSLEQAYYMQACIKRAWETLTSGESFELTTPVVDTAFKNSFNNYIQNIKKKSETCFTDFRVEYNPETMKSRYTDTSIVSYIKRMYKRLDTFSGKRYPAIITIMSSHELPDYFWIRRFIKLTRKHVLNTSYTVKGAIVSGDIDLLDNFAVSDEFMLSSIA